MSYTFIFQCAFTLFTFWAASRGSPATTVPAACYNECNNAYIEAQQIGKVPALCSAGNPFLILLTACQTCVAAHVGSNSSLSAYVDPEFAQFISFCSATATSTTTSSSSIASAVLVSIPSAVLVSISSAVLVSILSELSSRESLASLIHTSYSNLGLATDYTSASASATPGVSITTIYATLTPSSTPSSIRSGSANPSSTDLSSVSSNTTSTSHAWIAGAVVGPAIGIGAIILIIFLMRRRRRSRSAEDAAPGTKEKPNFDKAQLHADSLPYKDPNELAGSPIAPPAELPAREDVAVEMANRRGEEPV